MPLLSKLKPEKTGGCAPSELIDFGAEGKPHYRLAPRYDDVAAGGAYTQNRRNGEEEALSPSRGYRRY
jgi:hypothetical protein